MNRQPKRYRHACGNDLVRWVDRFVNHRMATLMALLCLNVSPALAQTVTEFSAGIAAGAQPTGITTTTQSSSSANFNFAAGWNLMGNSSSGALDVATAFSDPSKVNTVWKWNAGTTTWAFYAPSLVGQALTDYATSKGYNVLATINGGDGFWVNAKTTFNVPLPSGTGLSLAAANLVTGWNLVATGDAIAPGVFASNVGNVTTLLGMGQRQ